MNLPSIPGAGNAALRTRVRWSIDYVPVRALVSLYLLTAGVLAPLVTLAIVLLSDAMANAATLMVRNLFEVAGLRPTTPWRSAGGQGLTGLSTDALGPIAVVSLIAATLIVLSAPGRRIVGTAAVLATSVMPAISLLAMGLVPHTSVGVRAFAAGALALDAAMLVAVLR